jgi:hypothetical protein
MIPQGFKNIQNILSEFLGEPKADCTESGQLQFACPKCIEEKGENEKRKYNLEINLYKQVFQCWSCSSIDDSMKGKISKLIKKYGNHYLYQRYMDELDSLIKSKLYELDGFEIQQLIDNENIIRLPSSFKKINLGSCPLIVKNYLDRRKVTQDIIDKFNIGYTTWEDNDFGVRNRIVVPSYDEWGDLNYWSGRDFTGKSKYKYKNSDGEKTEIIFQESLIDFDSDIILCEGTFDAIYMNNCISLLGKTLKKDSKLYRTLKERANARVIIALDADTDISETKKIYSILNTGRLKDKVYFIRLYGCKDFGEIYEYYGKKGMIMTLRSMKKFSEIDLLFE